MDNIFIFIIVVLILLALGLYGVQLLPLPDPSGFIKPLLMLCCVAAAAFAIGRKAGVF